MALLAIVLPATAVWSLAGLLGHRRRHMAMSRLTLMALQAALLAAQAYWLSWTID
jgi:hypothetical protein